MTRLARPVNIEAMMAAPSAEAIVEVAPPVVLNEDVLVEAVAPSPVDEPAIEAVAEEPELEVIVSDDLTRLTGVGPKIALALAERGVERFEQLAAWTVQDLAAFDAELDLRGRAIRAGFVEQARRLATGEA